MATRWFLRLSLLTAVLLFSQPVWAQGSRLREEPMSLEQMERFQDIPFRAENFDKVTNGMSEEQVLSILGKPTDLKKDRRRHGRWTAHFFYPEGHTVNFRSGLVVGKERK
jgi:hypothetical protein